VNDAVADQKLMVLMFTDLVDSSALKIKLGDRAYANKVARPHNALFREILSSIPGAQENNYMGDGFLATFQRVSDAVNAGLRMQYALRNYPWEAHAARSRVGIHLGEAVLLEGAEERKPNISGHAADMCARVMNLALGGQILLTRHAFDDGRQYVRQHPPVPGDGEPPPIQWMAHGRYRLKGKDDDPLEVFEVGAVGLAPLLAPPNSDKAWRVVNSDEEETLGWRPAVGLEIPGRRWWLITSKLGEGGFGEVWLAQNAKTKQYRVFKFCYEADKLRSLKRELALFRLLREAFGERDDIVQLFDVRLDHPPFYLESEFIQSGNLAQWVEHHGGIQKIPLMSRLDTLARVARTVGAAHSLGIIHKDIKPSNIFVRELPDRTIRSKLADFGIGAIADPKLLEQHGITAAGFTEPLMGNDSSRTGTRLYAAPELLVGDPATAATDIYALGVLLYQLVVGDLGKPLAVDWGPDVNDELLREDIAFCVVGNPSRRMHSPLELAERLERLEQRREQQREERRTSLPTCVVTTFLKAIDYFSRRGVSADSPTELGLLVGLRDALGHFVSISLQSISDQILEDLAQLKDVPFIYTLPAELAASILSYHATGWSVGDEPPPVYMAEMEKELPMGDVREYASAELDRRRQLDSNERSKSASAPSSR
jgi:serine/threonine protein kinase/class 3 adenylate cyclase